MNEKGRKLGVGDFWETENSSHISSNLFAFPGGSSRSRTPQTIISDQTSQVRHGLLSGGGASIALAQESTAPGTYPHSGPSDAVFCKPNPSFLVAVVTVGSLPPGSQLRRKLPQWCVLQRAPRAVPLTASTGSRRRALCLSGSPPFPMMRSSWKKPHRSELDHLQTPVHTQGSQPGEFSFASKQRETHTSPT